MPHDPVRLEDTRAWLHKAGSDLRAAKVGLEAAPPLLEDVAFHCQQAVEKALKAFLTWHDRPFRRTHDLVELGGQCAEIEAALEPLLRRAAALSEYAWAYRYPGEPTPVTPESAERSFALAREVLDGVLARLPAEIRS